MAKITYKKKWVQWCDSCAHAFKTEAGEPIKLVPGKTKPTLLQRLKLKKVEEAVVTDYFKPDPSPCPVCGKVDNVTVMKLQEDKVTVYDIADTTS